MMHFKDKETYVLGVYVAETIKNPDPVIREALGLENLAVLTPEQMARSAKPPAYVLDATMKVVYSRSDFSKGSDVHIYLEKSSGRILVRVRHSIEAIADIPKAHQSVEKLASVLSERRFKPVKDSRIEDIPGICFV